MIKIIKLLLITLALVSGVKADNNGCISFTIAPGTGCAWMCNYCATNLGTNNYYFTDNVCTYESGVGCVGNPLAGKLYTCCSTSNDSFGESVEDFIDEL